MRIQLRYRWYHRADINVEISRLCKVLFFWKTYIEWKDSGVHNSPNIHILMHLKKSLLTSLLNALNNFLGNIRQRRRRCKNGRPNWIKHRPHFASEGIYRSSCWTSERFKSSEWCHINGTWHHPWSLGLRWSTSLLCVVPSFFIDTSSLYVGVWSQQRIKGNCSAMFPTRNFETSSH